MDIPIIEAEKEKAAEEYEKYKILLETKKEKHLKEMKTLNYHLKEGRKVLNIYDVFKKTGLKKDGEPKLAIARADRKLILFKERKRGAGAFIHEEDTWASNAGVDLPEGTFPESLVKLESGLLAERGSWRIEGVVIPSLRTWKAIIPIIPAGYTPKGNLRNYYILWEVEEEGWTVTKDPKPPKDPLLLRRISNNMFVVFAGWDLTPLEQAVMVGRL